MTAGKDFVAELNGNPLPFAQLLGIVFTLAEPERIVAEMPVRPELCTRPLMAFADTVGAAATVVNLPEGAGTTTLESKTNFLSGAPLGAKLIAEATPIHRGRSTQVWQTRITVEGGKLAAVVTQTQMVLMPRG
jgi:1,4-dihydroxy-2-naphthoyl-CoA hydrolase